MTCLPVASGVAGYDDPAAVHGRAVRHLLAGRNVHARVVSMPSWELFEEQPREYRDAVLPPAVRARMTIEAASTMGWHRYAGDAGDVVGIDHFGASAPASRLFQEFGFTPQAVAERAGALLATAATAGA